MQSAVALGAGIKAWRLFRGLTQEQLGEKVGVDGPRISRLERGTENPTLETLDAIVQALGLSDLGRLLDLPRLEDRTPDAQPTASDPGLETIIQSLDAEFPAEDSVEGDIHKAIAALTRALRRQRPPAAAG